MTKGELIDAFVNKTQVIYAGKKYLLAEAPFGDMSVKLEGLDHSVPQAKVKNLPPVPIKMVKVGGVDFTVGDVPKAKALFDLAKEVAEKLKASQPVHKSLLSSTGGILLAGCFAREQAHKKLIAAGLADPDSVATSSYTRLCGPLADAGYLTQLPGFKQGYMPTDKAWLVQQ